ncbi:MAG: hypothetical protein ACI3U8_09470, partial [Candidatus Onthomonas sp.]
GYGWYPVEMTPGGGTQLPQENLQQSQQPEEDTQPEQQPEEDIQLEQPELQTPESAEPEAPSQPETSTEAPAQTGTGKSGLFAALLSTLAKLLLLGLCLTGPAAALWGLRLLWLRHWERCMSQPDTNRAVLEIYGRFQTLTRWGGSIPEEITELAQKARFSQHQLTEGERRQAVGLLTRELRRVGKDLPSWKRLLFWLVWDR